MCNEYRFHTSLDRLAEEFSRLELPLQWEGGAPNLQPLDSIRPTDLAPVVVGQDDGALLRRLPWGFPRPRGGPLINFRSEDRRFPVGRCLVPADAFYEFTGEKPPKSKWLFTPRGVDFFCIAGLIRDERFTLLTTDAGPDIAPYHPRQVVILPRRHWAAWLGPADARPPLAPTPAGAFSVQQIR